jgi:hypothetical protein
MGCGARQVRSHANRSQENRQGLQMQPESDGSIPEMIINTIYEDKDEDERPSN